MEKNHLFAPPVRFVWKVSRAGYRWTLDSTGRRLICATDAATHGWNKLTNRLEYQPLEKRTGLFREFANINASEAAVRSFASMFGLLESDCNVELRSEKGPVPAHGETLVFWKTEIQRLKLAVDLCDAYMTGDRRNLVDPIVKLANKRSRFGLRPGLHPDDGDVAIAAVQAIEELVDQNVAGRVKARFLSQGSSPLPNLSLQPQSLLGAIWLQFAAAFEAHKTFANCQLCQAPFEISVAQTGKRSDARFCSDRCRVGFYRNRIDRARELGSTGMSPAKIARELGAQVDTVRGWLNR